MADRGIPRRVTYREVDEGYFEKRGLQRHAGVWSLWALGVAAVISGDFFGWNFGLDFGFGGLLVATIVITVMYLGLCWAAFGDDVVDHYLNYASTEQRLFDEVVTCYERERLFEQT